MRAGQTANLPAERGEGAEEDRAQHAGKKPARCGEIAFGVEHSGKRTGKAQRSASLEGVIWSREAAEGRK